MEALGVVRSVKKSEAIDGTHVRMKVIASEKEDLVRCRCLSMEINQHERPDVFACTRALKVFRMFISKAAVDATRTRTPQDHSNPGCCCCTFYADMDEVI